MFLVSTFTKGKESISKEDSEQENGKMLVVKKDIRQRSLLIILSSWILVGLLMESKIQQQQSHTQLPWGVTTKKSHSKSYTSIFSTHKKVAENYSFFFKSMDFFGRKVCALCC